jgi:cytochrome P450
MAMIGTHRTVQSRIACEISQVLGSITYDDAIRLPYTTASIKEAQRLYPVIGMSLSRKAPADGMHVNGVYFPPGTTVGCNPVSLHRNSDVFGPMAEEFIPDRWLDDDLTKGMERYNLTWGGGSRSCPGKHLAELVLYKAVPALIKEFEVEAKLPPEHDIRYFFMAMLSGVKVRFIPRN